MICPCCLLIPHREDCRGQLQAALQALGYSVVVVANRDSLYAKLEETSEVIPLVVAPSIEDRVGFRSHPALCKLMSKRCKRIVLTYDGSVSTYNAELFAPVETRDCCMFFGTKQLEEILGPNLSAGISAPA